MNIPGMPTDSLYKWMAISGVVVLVSSGAIFITNLWELRRELSAHEQDLAFLSVTTQFGVAFGFVLAFIGFLLWYKRLQKYVDMEQKAKAEEQVINTRLAQMKLNELEGNAGGT